MSKAVYPDQRLQVLLIEDDPMVREVNKMFVDKLNTFEVAATAENGEEGREMLEVYEPDLVLLDVYMAHEDGLQCLEKLRASAYDVDVIAVTAANDTNTVKKLLRFGVVDYVVKPFTFERLKQALDQYVERRQQLSDEKVTQKKIDDLIYESVRPDSAERINTLELPKGIQRKTLNQVVQYMNTLENALSAEEVGEAVGLARVTVRRYLSYLEAQGDVEMDMHYGQVGRPIQLYHLTKQGIRWLS
ncbi:two-component system response regulator DctR [Salsuginibacillus halophilus]|uniref:Two-component system response regulator DctR n=1 Tax=Salsuginibacillus halophilus TaxID=517424 RepID=A0A2P8HLF0_9BACI|nr:response regulator [Salsuginibacillus halophilus]PSL47010.1 two-component system response regulator DctR [Salsuginibacillus halophilus]